MIVREDLRRHYVTTAADAAGLDPALAAAFCDVESSWDAHAVNPEPRYRYLVDVRDGRPFRQLTAAEMASESPPADFPSLPGVPADAEWQLQQMSLGLMQVMGAVARECGFKGRFLTELCEPEIGLAYGCRKLAALSRRGASLEDVAAAYNAGTARRDADGKYVNQGYVDKIAAAFARYEREWS